MKTEERTVYLHEYNERRVFLTVNLGFAMNFLLLTIIIVLRICCFIVEHIEQNKI